MLVLSRRQGESVMIGDGVTVTVLEVRGDVVRIGVDAPREVKVHREEVWRELQKSNLEAASPSEAAVAALSALLPGAARDSRADGRTPEPAALPADQVPPPAAQPDVSPSTDRASATADPGSPGLAASDHAGSDAGSATDAPAARPATGTPKPHPPRPHP